MGLGTVPYCAVKLKRSGIGCELAPLYFADAAAYCKAAESDVSMPDLFDLLAAETDTTDEAEAA